MAAVISLTPAVRALQSREAIVLLCRFVCWHVECCLELEAAQCQEDAGRRDQVQREQYVVKDWTSWLIARFKS